MPDLTLEELKKNKTLQKLDQANAKLQVKAFTREDELRLMEEHDTRQKAQDGYAEKMASITSVLTNQWETPAAQPKYKYARELEIAAKHKKKKSAQQAEATRRAEEQGLMPETDQSEALQRVVDEHVVQMLAEPMDTTIDTRITSGPVRLSMLHLTGKEFVPDPETGMLDAPKLLSVWRRLKNEHNQLKLIRSAKEACNSENLAVMQANSEVFAVLDEAVHAYFTANGINCDTGEAARPGEVQSARKKLALAMENYREVAEKYSGILSGYYLPLFKKDFAEEYEKQKGQLNPPDGALTTDRRLNKTRDRVRQWIASNPEAYAANKSKVDKAYQELFASMTNAERMRTERAALYQTFRNVREEDKEEHPVRKKVRRAAYREYKRKERLLKSHIRRLEESLRFMLTGEEPENFGSMLYIEKNYGLVTPGLEDTRYREQLMQQWPQKEVMRINPGIMGLPNTTDLKELRQGMGRMLISEEKKEMKFDLQKMYDLMRVQCIEAMVQNARELRKDPNNAVEQRRAKLLRMAFGSTDFSLLQETLCSLQDNIQLMREQVDRVMQKGIDGVDGAEHRIPDEAIYRDMPMHLMPLGHAHEMDEEELVQECNQLSVLQRGIHLNGAAGTDQEQQDAVAHELQVQRQAKAEIAQHLWEYPLLYNLDTSSPLQILNAYPTLFLVREKVSALVARAELLRNHPKFANLSEQDKKDAKELAVFFTACNSFTRSANRIASRRTGVLMNGREMDGLPELESFRAHLKYARAEIK